MAYNADRRRQLWEQTARDDLKELTELRALVRKEEEKADAQKKEAYARGAEVGDTIRAEEGAGGQDESDVTPICCSMPVAAYLERGVLRCLHAAFFVRGFRPCGGRPPRR